MKQLVVELWDESESHKAEPFPFNDQTTLEQLQSYVHSTFQIEPKHQHLFCDSQRINLRARPSDTLQRLGLKDDGIVVVKHSLLGNWKEFILFTELAKEILQKKSSGKLEDHVEKAVSHLKILDNSAFFLVYTNFGSIYRSFKTQFAFYFDIEFKYIEIAARDYFSKFYKDNPECPVLEIKCTAKEHSGVQGGLECYVYQSGELLNKYHVKVHTRLAKWHGDKSADLRELFAYKVLELINVGPKVHFLPNTHYSGFGLYIATEDVRGFRRESDICNTDEERMAELSLLRCAFFLKDLITNDENYGVNDQGKLSIVDFEVGEHSDSPEVIVNKYLSKNKPLHARVGKACFSSWNLHSTVDRANDAIANQKKLLRTHSISYKSGKNFDEYLTNIKNNIVALASSFE